MGSGRNISDCLEVIRPFQASTLSIIQCQHVNGFSLFLSNFSIFPLMLQRQCILLYSSCFCVIKIKNYYLCLHPTLKLQPLPTICLLPVYLCYSSIVLFFFNYGSDFFQVIRSRPDCVYLYLVGAV
jgi:hypothetical protein